METDCGASDVSGMLLCYVRTSRPGSDSRIASRTYFDATRCYEALQNIAGIGNTDKIPGVGVKYYTLVRKLVTLTTYQVSV
jgi:hypothetical protein